jgi:hypothetical protein
MEVRRDMAHHSEAGSHSDNRFKLRSRPCQEPLSTETPRFHIFLIDTGWNGPVSKLLRSQLPLIQQYHPKDPLYILTHEQSIQILKNAPEHIGRDPIVVVYDLHSPRNVDPANCENYRGFRLNLGLIKSPEQALLRLQHFVRFIALNRQSECLECEVKRELHKEGMSNWVKVLRDASEASLELL